MKIFKLSVVSICGEFIHGHRICMLYGPVIKPLLVLSETVSVCLLVGHASNLTCPDLFPLNVTFPICTSHNYLTWQALSRFLVPLTSLVTENISCLEITSGLFSMPHVAELMYGSLDTDTLSVSEEKWRKTWTPQRETSFIIKVLLV